MTGSGGSASDQAFTILCAGRQPLFGPAFGHRL